MDKEQILKIVDRCFHMFASDFRKEAKKEAEKMIEKQLALCNVSEWVAVSKNTPALGTKVFAITYNDDKVRMIAWGTGDEAFYEYWMVLNIPEPPFR